MPMLIWNITDYFYHKQKELYYIRFKRADDFDDKEYNQFSDEEQLEYLGEKLFRDTDYRKINGRREILDWFAQNLPNTEIKPLFLFTSDSGILSCPYDGTLYVDFDEESLQKFCEVWEDGNNNSADERFQCYYYPLENYKAKYDGKIPNPDDFFNDDEL